MSIQIKDTLYIIHHKPSNRKERRIAQKEYEKIQKSVLPIVFAYVQEENKTDSLRLRAKEEYLKWLPKANNGNIFVQADPFFFEKHFPTEKKIAEIIKPPVRVKQAYWFLLAVLAVIVTAVLVSLSKYIF